MQSVSNKDCAVDGTIERQMAVAMTRHVQDAEPNPIADRDVLAAAEGQVDALRRSRHLADPFLSFRIRREADFMLRKPLVIASCEKAIRIFDRQPIEIATGKQNIRAVFLDG